MREIDIYDFEAKIFEKIKNEWFLLAARKKDKTVNAMTAQWGSLGFLWNKPVATVFVRPQRYTHEFTEDADIITMSFFEEKYRDMLNYFGTVSGRDEDKIKKSGLTLIDSQAPIFKQADISIVLEKLYSDEFKEENFKDKSLIKNIYKIKDFHTFYICEVKKIYEKSEV